MGTLRLTAVTAGDVAKIPKDGRYGVHSKPAGGRYEAPQWWREKVPPPPDYSTPQAVTARCREAGGWRWDPSRGPSDYGNAYVLNTWLRASWAAEKDQTVAKAYRAFMAACHGWRDPTPAAPHGPGVGQRWDARRVAETLKEIRKEST